MSKLIAICGIDGSGKTMQLKLLEKHLKRRGFKVKYVWFRWVAFVSYPLLALCRLLGYTKWRTIKRSNVRYAERRFYMNRALARIWPWLFTFDVIIHFIFRIALPMRTGYRILCDRYILDILVDLMYDTKDSNLHKKIPGRLLASRLNNSTIILIDVNEQTAYERKNDILSIENLKERRKLYLKLAHALKISIINGEKKPANIHQEILRILTIS
ncbi:hypothetical protein KEJ27_09685 [Candidatus Bathyarchaeota archaeon]|nr:hypothetical protein [Candidatus Bathyarchaeota archaeon]